MIRFNRRGALVAAGLCLAAAGASAQQSVARSAPAPWATQRAAAPMVDPNVALSTFGGSFVLNFTITIKSIIPSSFPIQCGATLMATDMAAGGIFSEDKIVFATRSGNTATCSITVPYSWSLSSASTPVSTTYMITTTGTGSSLFERISTGMLPSITVPVNGTTSTRAIAITI